MTPALIDALQGFRGVTIRIRHPLPPASMRLLDTLDARVVVDPEAPECAAGTSHHGGCPDCRASDRPP